MTEEIVIVYVDGLPMCRQPAWDARMILAARESGVSLCCSHKRADGEKLAAFLQAHDYNAYVRYGDDNHSLCEPMPYWDEDGYEEIPEFDYESRWYPEG